MKKTKKLHQIFAIVTIAILLLLVIAPAISVMTYRRAVDTQTPQDQEGDVVTINPDTSGAEADPVELDLGGESE